MQDRSHLDPEFCLIAVANGQAVLTVPGEEFFERVDWSGDEPAAWRPHEDPVSPVRVNPLVRFGMPAVGGISTEAMLASSTAAHPRRRWPTTSASTSTPCGGRKVMSCRSAQPDEPACGPGPHLRRR
jgi:hypothetical protein